MWGDQTQDFNESRGGGGKRGSGAGGFVAGGDTPGGAKSGKRGQNIVPVTIRQILDSPEETLKIVDQEVSLVTVVGLVTHVEQTSVKMSFTLDDQTGSIDALKYLTDGDGAAKPIMLMEGTYARVIGQARNQKGQDGRYITIYKIAPVLDMNEVTCHMLEVCQVSIKLKKLQQEEAQKTGFGGNAFPAQTTASMMGNNLGGNTSMGGGGGNLQGLNANQNMVFRAIQSVSGDEGVNIETIVQNLKNKMSAKEVRDTIEFLSGEGHIYSTKDDEHFKTTDW